MKKFATLFLAVAVLIAGAGCKSPARVRKAQDMERKAIVAYGEDVVKMATALLLDLKKAWEKQIAIVFDYEARIRHGDQEKMNKLIAAHVRKVVALKQKFIETIKKVAGSDRNLKIALRIHDAITAWLLKKGVSKDEQKQFVGMVSDIAKGIKDKLKSKKKDDKAKPKSK